MKGGLLGAAVAVALGLTITSPAVAVAKTRRPVVRISSVQPQIAGKDVTVLKREVRLAFVLRYGVYNVPARRRARARVRIVFTRAADRLEIGAGPAATETGRYRWEVTGPNVRIPRTYAVGTYHIALTIEIVRRGAVIARRTRSWDMRVD